MDAVTVSCGVMINDAYTVKIKQYDDTFDSTYQTDLPAWETNYDSMVESQDYDRSWDKLEDYMLSLGLNGDTYIQSCIAEAEISPEESPDLFDRDYTVTVGGRVYDSYDAVGPDGFKELPAATYTYFIPAAEFEFETKEEIALEKEIVAEESFSTDAESYFEGVEGDIEQFLSAGFETNPYDDTANDKLGFQFELSGPSDAIAEGQLVYQWATI